MLDPHTTYNVNYFPRCVLVFCISKDSPAMLPINYVHLLPAIYYICSPCAAAILRSRFRNNCFDWILEEFSWWVLLVASLDNFLLSAEIVGASLLECIGRCASLHIWCQCCLIFFYRISWELKIQSIIVDMHWMFCRFAYFISPTHQTQKSIQSESFRQPPIAAPWKNKRLFCSFFKDLSP